MSPYGLRFCRLPNGGPALGVRTAMRRLLIALVAVLVVVPLLAAAAVHMLLDSDMLRQTIEKQGTAALGRAVHVGHAKAQIFPRAGIELTGVRLDGPQELTADQVVIGAGLSGLLAKRIEDAVVRVKNGRIAFGAGAATESGPAGATSDTAEGADGGFTIASVSQILFDNVVIAGGGGELRIDLDGALDGDRLNVRRLSVRSGTTSLDVKGTVTSLARRDGTFEVDSPLVDVDEVLAVVGALMPSDASARDTTAMAGDEATPSGVGHVTATVSIQKARALGYEIGNVATTLDVQGARLVASPLTFDLYGGHYDSTLTLDPAPNRTAFAHKVSFSGGNLATLAQLAGKPGQMTGTLGFRAEVRGAGKDFAAAAAGVTGTADVRLADGTLKGLDVVRQTFRLLGASAPATEDGERFESITAHLALAGGAMSADDFKMHSPDFDLNGRLHVDPAGALGGGATLQLSDALSKEAQSTNKDLKLMFEDGRITLPATIGGALDSPRVLPDVADLLKRAARNAVKGQVDKAKQQGTDAVKKKLRSLFPKP